MLGEIWKEILPSFQSEHPTQSRNSFLNKEFMFAHRTFLKFRRKVDIATC